MQTLELETMRCELDGPLARLRLHRPEALNAANWTWVQDLVKSTDYLARSSETRVVIVSGEGRAFCSGLDVKELSQGHLSGELRPRHKMLFDVFNRGKVQAHYIQRQVTRRRLQDEPEATADNCHRRPGARGHRALFE